MIIAGAFLYLGYQFGSADILILAPRHDTFEAAQEPAHAWLRLDPNAAEVLEILRYGVEDDSGFFLSIISAVLPYEASVVASAAPDAEVSRLVFAMSMRRLAGILEQRSSAQPWQWFPPQQVDSLALEGRGLWVVRSHLPVTEATRKAHELLYPPGNSEGIAPEGGYVLEGALDNRHGEAYLALSSLLVPPKVAGDMNADTYFGLDHTLLTEYFALVETVRLRANFVEPEILELQISVVCRDEASASAAMLPLLGIQDMLYQTVVESGGYVTGDFEVDGREIEGLFLLHEVKEPLVGALRKQGVL